MIIKQVSDLVPILRVEGLRKGFNGFNLEVPVLDFYAGKIYGLTGPNGSGKTTLLSILNLLEKPDNGRLFYRGKAIPAEGNQKLRIRREMVMVLENPYVFNSSVIKNVTYGLKTRYRDKKDIQEKAEDALRMVNLSGFEDRKARELSRGETQRVAIARAIVLKPEILFLDEPFTNIDKVHIGVVEKLIKEINRKRNTTIIFTSHDLFQAYRLSDGIISIVGGRIIEGSLDNLFDGLIEEKDNVKWAKITPDLKIVVVTEMKGDINLLIPPEDIILSKKHFQSSARNVLEGKIKRIEIEKEIVRVCCEVSVEFIALITKASFDRMKLSIGSPVFLTFKTTSVRVF